MCKRRMIPLLPTFTQRGISAWLNYLLGYWLESSISSMQVTICCKMRLFEDFKPLWIGRNYTSNVKNPCILPILSQLLTQDLGIIEESGCKEKKTIQLFVGLSKSAQSQIAPGRSKKITTIWCEVDVPSILVAFIISCKVAWILSWMFRWNSILRKSWFGFWRRLMNLYNTSRKRDC